jgi:hypothetical protein
LCLVDILLAGDFSTHLKINIVFEMKMKFLIVMGGVSHRC